MSSWPISFNISSSLEVTGEMIAIRRGGKLGSHLSKTFMVSNEYE
jgi:hypothetical protein